MFKVYRKIMCNQIVELFSVCDNLRTRQGHINFIVPRDVITCRKKFIVHCGIMLWNNLPTDIKMTLSLCTFKCCLRTHIVNMHNSEFT
jgi:hypothetical protein